MSKPNIVSCENTFINKERKMTDSFMKWIQFINLYPKVDLASYSLEAGGPFLMAAKVPVVIGSKEDVADFLASAKIMGLLDDAYSKDFACVPFNGNQEKVAIVLPGVCYQIDNDDWIVLKALNNTVKELKQEIHKFINKDEVDNHPDMVLRN